MGLRTTACVCRVLSGCWRGLGGRTTNQETAGMIQDNPEILEAKEELHWGGRV